VTAVAVVLGLACLLAGLMTGLAARRTSRAGLMGAVVAVMYARATAMLVGVGLCMLAAAIASWWLR